MILECPNCHAQFNVPDAAIGPAGRDVRCAKCAHHWHAMLQGNVLPTMPEPLLEMVDRSETAQTEKAVENVIPDEDDEALSRKAAFIRRMKQQKVPILPWGWVGSATACALVMIFTVIFVFKPTTLGFPPSKGIVLAEVNILKQTGDNKPVYEISGKILNLTDDRRLVPTLKITAVDKKGEALQFWDYADQGKDLGPRQNIPFTSGILDVRFSSAERFVVELGNKVELSLRRKP